MQFRRLLTCAAVKSIKQTALPLVLAFSFSRTTTLTTYYYVEACDTLRIAIANMARGGSNRRTGISIKPLLADHLGIS